MKDYKTVIGKQTSFKGSVQMDNDLLICGSYEGDIISTADIEVAEDGLLNGDIICRNLTVRGKALGTATCSEILSIIPGGSYTGDVTVRDLCADRGSVFDGTIKMKK